MEIGKRIKSFRESSGVSQKDLAKKLNVHQGTVSSWEVGRTEPSIGQVEDIAKALGISRAELLGIQADYSINDIIIEHIKNYSEKQKALLLKYMELLESSEF